MFVNNYYRGRKFHATVMFQDCVRCCKEGQVEIACQLALNSNYKQILYVYNVGVCVCVSKESDSIIGARLFSSLPLDEAIVLGLLLSSCPRYNMFVQVRGREQIRLSDNDANFQFRCDERCSVSHTPQLVSFLVFFAGSLLGELYRRVLLACFTVNNWFISDR